MTEATHLSLPQVTLVAATSVNVSATVRALEASLAQVKFAECLLFTDSTAKVDIPSMRAIPIDPMRSSQAYSQFILSRLADFIATSHCLIIQWDGHVLDAGRWDPRFLDYDYIGASWPQFSDGHDVGNGGFSLRSKRLLKACQALRFQPAHPEDIMIGRTHRAWLEARGLRFAPRELADGFSAERAGNLQTSFGYHGVWHMPRALGPDHFWDIYQSLDDRSTIRHDFGQLLRQVSRGQGGMARAVKMLATQLDDALKKKG